MRNINPADKNVRVKEVHIDATIGRKIVVYEGYGGTMAMEHHKGSKGWIIVGYVDSLMKKKNAIEAVCKRLREEAAACSSVQNT